VKCEGDIDRIITTAIIVRLRLRQRRMRQRDQRLKASKPGSHNLSE